MAAGIFIKAVMPKCWVILAVQLISLWQVNTLIRDWTLSLYYRKITEFLSLSPLLSFSFFLFSFFFLSFFFSEECVSILEWIFRTTNLGEVDHRN